MIPKKKDKRPYCPWWVEHNKDGTLAEITFAELKVWLCLRGYMSRSTLQAFPSIATIGAETGFSKRAVINGIKRLKARGWLTVGKTAREETGGEHNRYTLLR
jgi:hypothetical protein